ncbi:MAG TPA: hypothetical protein VGR25_12725 [bacterium]|jgi:hypothetical protein|nr:hypothetical protein [bacterium]
MRLIALIGAGVVAAGVLWPSATLVVTNESGAALWRLPVHEGSVVVLEYTNSLYLAPVWERFSLRGGQLQLVEVSSTSEAVLEYNRHPGPYRRNGRLVSALVPGPVLDLLPLRVGEQGRPTLEVDGVALPLYRAGVGAGLRISVRRASRLLDGSALALPD